MNNEKHPFVSANAVYYAVVLILFYAATYSGIFNFNIGNALPVPLLAAIVAVAFFYGPQKGFILGLITGIAADAVAANTVCFNTFCFAVLGLAAGLAVTYYFNSNLPSALLLSFVCSAVYYTAKWLIFFLIPQSGEPAKYLIFHALPSAIYTSLFIIPLFFIQKFIQKRNNKA